MTTVKLSQDELVKKLSEKYSVDRKYYKSVREDWVKSYKQYLSQLDSDSSKDYYKWRSKLFVPATAKAVDGLLPDLLLTLFGNDPFFAVVPRNPMAVDKAKKNEGLLSYDFDTMSIFHKAHAYIKQLAMYGTTFGKVFWKKETLKIKKKIEVIGEDGMPKEESYELEEVVFDQPWFEPIDNFAITWGRKATSLEDTHVYHRTEKTIGEIKKAGIYKNIDKLEAMIASDKLSEKYETEIRNYMKGLPAAYSSEDGDDRRVEVLEYWDNKRKKTCTIGGQRAFLKEMRDNPYGAGYDPFVSSSLWPMPFELLGMGIPEKVRDIQDQINTEVNQRLDNRNLRQNLIFKVRRGANVNTRNLKSFPGAVWLTDDMTALEVVSMPDTSSPNSFAETTMLENKAEEISGVTKYTTGAGQTSRRTATEVSNLTKAGSKGFALHSKLLEDSFIRPLLRKCMYLNSKFMEKERVIRILGNVGGYDFTAVTPDDVKDIDYDLIPQGATQLTDKNLKVQQMVNYMGLIANDPQMVPFKHFIHKKIWELWGNKDFDIILSQTPQMPPALPVAPPVPGGSAPAGGSGGAPINPITPMGARVPSPMEGSAPIQMGNPV